MEASVFSSRIVGVSLVKDRKFAVEVVSVAEKGSVVCTSLGLTGERCLCVLLGLRDLSATDMELLGLTRRVSSSIGLAVTG